MRTVRESLFFPLRNLYGTNKRSFALYVLGKVQFSARLVKIGLSFKSTCAVHIHVGSAVGDCSKIQNTPSGLVSELTVASAGLTCRSTG